MTTAEPPDEGDGADGFAPIAAIQARLRAIVSAARFGKFVSVGVLGAVCDNTVLLLASELGVSAAIAALLGVPGAGPEVAKAMGVETAVVVMFAVNDRWTFAGQGAAGVLPWLRRLATSNVVRLGGIAVQLLVFSLVYRLLFVDISPLGVDLWLLVASGCGIAAGMFVNFVTESLLTWRVHDAG